MEQLEPCPWCNGPAETNNNRWNGRDHWGVQCNGCGDPWFDCRADTEAEAIALWNTRSPDARNHALEEAAKVAALYVINGGELHPDVPSDQIDKTAKMIAHTTCQYIATAICALIKDQANAG